MKALHFVQENLEKVMLAMEKVDCGITGTAVANIFVNMLNKKGQSIQPERKSRANSKRLGTIIESLGQKLKVEVSGASFFKRQSQ